MRHFFIEMRKRLIEIVELEMVLLVCYMVAYSIKNDNQIMLEMIK